jgi:hypothetical protein
VKFASALREHHNHHYGCGASNSWASLHWTFSLAASSFGVTQTAREDALTHGNFPRLYDNLRSLPTAAYHGIAHRYSAAETYSMH